MEIEDRELSKKSLWRMTFILGGLGTSVDFQRGNPAWFGNHNAPYYPFILGL